MVQPGNIEGENTSSTNNAPISRRLKAHYDAIAERYPIRTDDTYSTLVIPSGNDTQPFHRWFHIKEGFAWNLSQKFISETDLSTREDITFIDPFLGTGSSIIGLLRSQSSSLKRISAYGIERNPFLKFVASTTIKAMRKKISNFEQFGDNVLEEQKTTYSSDIRIPDLSTFRNKNYFTEGTIQSLVNLRQCINKLAKNNLNRGLGLLCLASIVESVGFLRRDGRALRYVPDKAPSDPCEEFKRRVEIVADDLKTEPILNTDKVSRVYLSDGRRPHRLIKAKP